MPLTALPATPLSLAVLLAVYCLPGTFADAECGAGYECTHSDIYGYGCAPLSNGTHMSCCSSGQQYSTCVQCPSSGPCHLKPPQIPVCPYGPVTGTGCVRSEIHVATPLSFATRASRCAGKCLRFDTIEEARDHLRMTQRTTSPQPRTVTVHPGHYPPLHLSHKDSPASAEGTVTYRGLDGAGPVVISAGITIPNSAFTEVGTGPLVRADLFDHGVSAAQLGKMLNGGGVGDCQHEKTDLIFDGARMTLARWPNIAADGGWRFANIDSASQSSVAVNTTVQPEASRLSRWASERDPWLHGCVLLVGVLPLTGVWCFSYWTFDWTDSYVRVGNIKAEPTGEISMSVLSPTPIKPNARFYGVNLLCELDVAGEYWIDSTNGTLYFYPQNKLKDWEDGSVVLTTNQSALDISGVRHHKFEQMEVRNSQGVGILAVDVTDVTLDGIVSANHGTNGIVISGDGYTVQRSTVHDTGCVGIQSTGGDTAELKGGGNSIHNNTVSRNALWKRTYMAGILWGGYNNSYTQNRVSDGPHNCFLGGGNEFAAVDCLHQDNTIRNCAYEASDTGAWYSCGQANTWTDRGNRAINNSFSEIRCKIGSTAPRSVEGCGGGVQAVYLDDQISGWLFEGNHFEDCDTAFFVGGGRDNVAVNNSFHNCSLAVHLDNRGMNWEASECSPTGKAFADVVAVTNSSCGSEWLARFPALKTILDKDHLCVPVYNRIEGNTFSDVGRFIDASESDYTSWLVNVTGNTNTTAIN